MIGWELGLVGSVIGILVILVRRLPSSLSSLNAASSPQAKEPKVRRGALKDYQPKPVNDPSKIGSHDQLPQETENVTLSVNEALPRTQAAVESAEVPFLKTRGSDKEAEDAFRAGEFALAAQIYEYLLAGHHDNPKFYNRLGIIYLELERFHDARDAFRTALKFGDQIASRHANLAMAEFALGHRLTAVRHIKRAMALAPNSKRYQELLEAFEDNS